MLSALGLLAGASVRRDAMAVSDPPTARGGELVAQLPAAAPTPLGLGLTLRFRDGTSKTFGQASASDIGDYVGPFVHQKCFAERKGEWTVFFRPDADRSRDEVVVERGKLRLAPGESPSHLLEPYTATILKDGKRIAEVTVPHHWWFARWRWQSAPRKIVRTYKDLIALKAIMPLSTEYAFGNKPLTNDPVRSPTWSGPMSTGGLAVGMGAGGVRPELGPITEYNALYLLTADPAALRASLAQAEAVGSWPVWVRDDQTGALLDVYTHPNVDFLYTSSLKIPQPPMPKDGQGNYPPNWFFLDTAHLPDPAYVPWLLTDDPYFYEGLELTGTWALLYSSYHRDAQKLQGLVNPGETRAWAWGLRTVSRLAAFAPASPPSWLLPQSYWQRVVADNLTYTAQYVASPARVHTVFRTFTRTDDVLSWMDGYVMTSLAWIVWSGFFPPGWRTFTEWHAPAILSYCDGKSGWDRRWPAPYELYLTTMKAPKGTEFPSLCIPDASTDAGTPESWTDAWRTFPSWTIRPNNGWPHYAGQAPLNPATWTDPNRIYENAVDAPYGTYAQAPSGPEYLLIIRGAVAALAMAGIPEAAAAHNWLKAKMPAAVASYGPLSIGVWKWAYSVH